MNADISATARALFFSLALSNKPSLDSHSYVANVGPHELELELILSQMAQKPMLRGEVATQHPGLTMTWV